MPFIEVKTNQEINDKIALKAKLGDAITAIPGKSEAWLMVELNEKRDMFFKGSDEPCAMFEVEIFGKASDDAYDDLTKRICAISEECLGIPANRTYIKYEEIHHWGYDGFNF